MDSSTDIGSDSESICSLFEMFGDILINDKVKYWLYPIESDQWSILYKWIKKNNIKVLTSICKDNIKKNDVVIIYHKNTTHNKRHLGHGIIGLAQVSAEPDANYKHKIFIDKRFQKIVVTLKVLTIHNRALKITELEPFIKDHKDYKSEIKFYDKYVFNSSEFLPLDNKFGINFVEGFTELSQKNYKPPSNKKIKNVSIDSVPFTTPSTNSEDNDNDSVDNDSEDNDSEDNDSEDNDSEDNDSEDNDSVDNDSVDNDSVDNDSVDNDSVDNDSVDNDSEDNDSVDNDSVDNDSEDNDSVDNDSVDNDSVDNDSKDNDNINSNIFTKFSNKEIKKDNINSNSSDDNKKNSLSKNSNLSDNNKKNSLSKNSNSSDDNKENSSLNINNKKNSLSFSKNNSKINSLSEISKNTKYDTDSSEKDKKKIINKDSENNNDNIRIAMIPIMICPCVKFAIPDVKNYYKKEDRETIVKYFKKHYLSCNDCDITNNNNKELSFYFEKADFDYDESDKYDKEIDDEIDSYQNCIPIFPDDDSKELDTPIIKIKYINKESCYRHCLLILWTI